MKYELITWTHRDVVTGYGALIINGKKRNPLYNGEEDDWKWQTEAEARTAARRFINSEKELAVSNA